MERERLDSFDAVLEEAARFRDERNWAQFHTPKNLAAAVAVEAAELQEIFLWAPERNVPLEPEALHRVEEELADVLIHCANLALLLGIDLAAAVTEKFEVNGRKYPVEKARDNATKYTDRDRS